MTFTVGGVDVSAVSVGATPAVAVYLGSEKVWPTAAPPAGFSGSWFIGPPTTYPPVRTNLPSGHFTLRDTAGSPHKYLSWWDNAGTDRKAEMLTEVAVDTYWTLTANGESITFRVAAINTHSDGGILITTPDNVPEMESFFTTHQGSVATLTKK